ncbi:aldo/keto reductase [Candidatus Puniceispirillum sp.]|uniref:aldo/keto reductase n=1 Tax=Candidatus Puniceispirillum sp. TaxID=2026719 RepID=UPI003F69E87F
MRYKKLGSSDLNVSMICLGSMTWGTQNTVAEGAEQIDMALDHGVNVIDTAEMYPTTPLSKETQGDTERVIGAWVKASGRRQDVMLATKVAGAGYANVRDGAPISPQTIKLAVEASLTSMATDYIDLYQLHWPNRGSYMFRQNWTYDPTHQNKEETLAHMYEVLLTLQELKNEGKIRAFGLSNESAWGTSQWIRMSEQHDLPRMVAIQNEYSLLCRMFDTDLSETVHNEDIGLLAFSPLAAGLLSGKYAPDVTPAGSRRSLNESLGGRINEHLWPALDAYRDIANRHGLDLCQMAIAWTLTRPFMASSIIGATSMDQLETILGAADLVLSDEVMAEIQATFRKHPMPY